MSPMHRTKSMRWYIDMNCCCVLRKIGNVARIDTRAKKVDQRRTRMSFDFAILGSTRACSCSIINFTDPKLHVTLNSLSDF